MLSAARETPIAFARAIAVRLVDEQDVDRFAMSSRAQSHAVPPTTSTARSKSLLRTSSLLASCSIPSGSLNSESVPGFCATRTAAPRSRMPS